MHALQKTTSKSSSSRSSLQKHLPKYLQVRCALLSTVHIAAQGFFRNRFDTDPSERKASTKNILLKGDRREKNSTRRRRFVEISL